MKKRSCKRLRVPGTTLFFKPSSRLFSNPDYPDSYYPVIDFSRGGAKFLCNDRLKAGSRIVVKLNIPGIEDPPELAARVRWISKNPEQSYRYQTGIAFNTYGKNKDENSPEALLALKRVESQTFDTQGG